MVFLSRQVYGRLHRLRKMDEGIPHPDRTNKKNFIFRMTWVCILFFDELVRICTGSYNTLVYSIASVIKTLS